MSVERVDRDLTIKTPRACIALLRRTTLLAAVCLSAPLVSSCVSAVDDTSSFGFNANPQGASASTPGSPAEDASSVASGEDDKAGAETAETLAAAAGSTAGKATAAEAEAKTSDAEDKKTALLTPTSGPGIMPPLKQGDAAEDDGDKPIATGRTSIAAYAGGTVRGSSSTPQANNTLFASLFADSKAKTPIRNAEKDKGRRVILKTDGPPVPVGSDNALPGVDPSSLFEIGQRASADDEDMIEDASDQRSYQVAALTGMARLSPNGLLVQREDVQTACFGSDLVGLLRAVEQKFGKKVVVTSGYRSPSHNRRVNGARRSMHMQCKAADIQVPGVDKFTVASFVRSLPGRGGVGTYCYTTAIHVDTGRERDWNWQCRQRRRVASGNSDNS
ncbi:YcbK family protein [Mangrovicella endophytica]|uniref:YcbK family protein n=1 Tax=Mangrovicella endophytica TaxID=2066697 RepID=UPI001FDF6E96|nr:D-Ala-D-Ala carboxypeptidase family metallohydrolase [Mangrovicella endophytica]